MTAKNCTLTQHEVKRLFNYDPDTGILTRKITITYNSMKGDIVGSYHKGLRTSYLRCGINGNLYLVHRLIFLYMKGYLPKEIDHIDGNGLNNKWNNIRDVCHLKNLKNQRLRKTNKLGLYGICWNKNANKWQASITVNYKIIYLGIFNDFFEACCVRKSAENKYDFHHNHGSIMEELKGPVKA